MEERERGREGGRENSVRERPRGEERVGAGKRARERGGR